MPEKQMMYEVIITRGDDVRTSPISHNNEEDAYIQACNIILNALLHDQAQFSLLSVGEMEEIIDAIDQDQYEGAVDAYNDAMGDHGYSVEVGYTRVFNDKAVMINQDNLEAAKALIGVN